MRLSLPYSLSPYMVCNVRKTVFYYHRLVLHAAEMVCFCKAEEMVKSKHINFTSIPNTQMFILIQVSPLFGNDRISVTVSVTLLHQDVQVIVLFMTKIKRLTSGKGLENSLVVHAHSV